MTAVPVVIANRQPYFSQSDQIQIPEQVRAVTQLSALDLDGDQLSYSILGGPDAQLFDLSPDGTLLFSQAPDFELPSDSDADNSYQLSVGVSDGMATDSMALSIEVRDRFEGRVVDDPVAGAAVFVDLNNNHQDDNEPSAVSDSQGYFVLNSAMPDNAAGSMLVSKGGINTHSNFPVPNLVLMAEVPSGTGGALVVTPLSTVLAGVQSNTERQQLLQQLGIDQPVSGLLSTDPWKAAIEVQPAALAIQLTNEQLALLAIT
ncbi:MAG: cadherin repeat domain-containing protein, partial [Porticoccaceae bacterium]|nr:cadherin repeat domain-containing protein [Porticoccaceae bacterium]